MTSYLRRINTAMEKNDKIIELKVYINTKAIKNEIKNLLELSKKDNDWIRLWRTYTGKKPNKWVVWPHSKSKGWCDRITGNL
mgnify:CR=1 FL=1